MQTLQIVFHFSECSFCIAELDDVQVWTTTSFHQEQFQDCAQLHFICYFSPEEKAFLILVTPFFPGILKSWFCFNLKP